MNRPHIWNILYIYDICSPFSIFLLKRIIPKMSSCCIFMKVKTIFVFQRNINIKFIGEKSTVFIIEDTGNILFLYNFLKNISFHFMSEWENRFFFGRGWGRGRNATFPYNTRNIIYDITKFRVVLELFWDSEQATHWLSFPV